MDLVTGFSSKAVLRWRLLPGYWILSSEGKIAVLTGPKSIKISVSCSSPLSRVELREGSESLYYLKKTSLPVLEVEANHSCTFITEIDWHS